MNKSHIISACAAAVAVAVSSAELAPVVTLGDVSQHGDRVVNVPYTLANAPAVVTFAVETNNGASGWSRLPSSAVSTVKGDVNKLVLRRICRVLRFQAPERALWLRHGPPTIRRPTW